MDGDYGTVSDMGNGEVSFLSSPLSVCELGEGPFSLNHPLSHYPAHLNYSILRKDHQLWPACAFCPCFSKVLFANWKKIFVLVYNVACRICVVWICCHLGRNFYGMRICDVVCHGGSDMSLSFCGMKSYNIRVYEMIWSDSCRGHGGCYSCI